MEIKNWGYEEFPEFSEPVKGAVYLQTTGDEKGVRCKANIEYCTVDGHTLHMHLLYPFTRNQQEGVYPCIVFVQGSAWKKQDPLSQVALIARLAERGHVVASVEYRHSKIASFPAQALDTRNAVRFLRLHAKEYGIDPEKMIMMGTSSGGHAAMFAGIIHDDDKETNLFPGTSGEVKAIIDLYGSVSVMLEDGNPSTLNHHLPDSPEGMEMGGVNLREHPELCRKLSVECNIGPDTKLAPVLIVHGTKDRTVNAKESKILYERLRECNKEAELYFIRGGDHGGAEYWTDEILDIEEAFIKKYCR